MLPTGTAHWRPSPSSKGQAPALDFGASFDGVRPHAIGCQTQRWTWCWPDWTHDVCEALQVMVERTRAVHSGSVRTDI